MSRYISLPESTFYDRFVKVIRPSTYLVPTNQLADILSHGYFLADNVRVKIPFTTEHRAGYVEVTTGQPLVITCRNLPEYILLKSDGTELTDCDAPARMQLINLDDIFPSLIKYKVK